MRHQRARTVRPEEDDAHRLLLQPVVKEASGDLEGGMEEGDDSMFYPDHLGEDEGGGEQENVERLDQKYQKLKDQVEEYFDDENGKAYRQPPHCQGATTADSRGVREAPDDPHTIRPMVQALFGCTSRQKSTSIKR